MVRAAVLAVAAAAFTAAPTAVGQQIYDLWTTTWERSNLFTYKNLGSNPINFVSSGDAGNAQIVVDDTNVLQGMAGFGATLTDSSALLLNNLKSKNSGNYWGLINKMFEPNNHVNAGLSYLRVPLGASDFSASVYTFDDTAGDTSLNHFNISAAPSYLFSVIKDIQSVNPFLNVHILPWSPPAWMKSSNSIKGGKFLDKYSSTYASYLLKALQGFQSKGITAYAISIQNEPESQNPSLPSCLINAAQEAAIGKSLRSLMNSNGFTNTKIVGYDHNWSDAGGYPVTLLKDNSDPFSGVSFHCYDGTVSNQDTFHTAFPNKDIYFTECTGVLGTDWWSDIKWGMDNIMIGAPEHFAKTGMMWTLALDGKGQPKLPGASSCKKGCRAVVTINNDGTYEMNQEFFTLAAASKAITPKDSGGPFAQRIGVSVKGGESWALRVGAYVTARKNSADWLRYSLVVLNWNDGADSGWDPQPVRTAITFRGKQATYTFPVGVTTLWFYAPNEGHARRDDRNVSVPVTAADAKVEGALDAHKRWRKAKTVPLL